MENKKMSTEEIYAAVQNILGQHSYVEDNGDGTYAVEVYADPYDRLRDTQLEAISQADNPHEAFIESLDEYVFECEGYAGYALLDDIKSEWNKREYGSFADVEDEVRDFLIGNVHADFPYNHFLQQKVLVNLVVDAGDANYDYTLNSFANAHYYDDDQLSPESGLVWLVKQQGHSVEELIDVINSEEGNGNKFIDSIVEESANVTTSMNALTFSVQMSLEDFIKIKENKVDLTLEKSTTAGLVDYWNGAGSMHDIQLDKEVTLSHNMYDAHIDGARGYGIMEIYGVGSDFWTDTVVSMEVKGNE
ncbi:hypothetical protein Grass_219 [Bacillus phage Grass]|uniref:Uncharacterized protein n=1 Tax=Bacillus phage Grass TaxID=1406785 RepID=U5PUE3_BPGRA|nr:hypothetical protein Grass_219 [Bacillus phage Grass]AGY47484.1 hypothetical protein Grass_219 [Bacillus phage Grass]